MKAHHIFYLFAFIAMSLSMGIIIFSNLESDRIDADEIANHTMDLPMGREH